MDYEKDSFEDIVSKDPRYNARAYTLLMDVFECLQKEMHDVPADAILDDFRDAALDEFGPLAFRVLEEWGVKRCEDIGEMMFNLTDSGRIAKSDNDTKESFLGGYDFHEAFLMPFEPQ